MNFQELASHQRLDVYRYALDLRSPVVSGRSMISQRQGFLLKVNDAGLECWGECAPLDGYSNETFNEILTAISSKELDQASSVIMASFPSWQWGWECATGQLPMQLSGSIRIPVARLIQGRNTEDIVQQAHQAVLDGFDTLKLKVGRQTVDHDIILVKAVGEAIPPRVGIRLDANRQWSLKQACYFSSALEGVHVEFIEEPLRHFNDYTEYNEHQPHGFALDESLMERAEEDIKPLSRLAALVLKPTLLGGLVPVNKWIAMATSMGCKAVISGMYESGVGIRALLRLAAHHDPSIAVGLDTYDYLQDDVVTPRLSYDRGAFLLNESEQTMWHVSLDKLEKLT